MKKPKNSKTFIGIIVACIVCLALSFVIPISLATIISHNNDVSRPESIRHNALEYNNALYVDVLYDKAGKLNLPINITEDMVGDFVGEGTSLFGTGAIELYKYAKLDVDALVVAKIGDNNILFYFYDSNDEHLTGNDVLKMYGVNSAQDIEKIICSLKKHKKTIKDKSKINEFINQYSMARTTSVESRLSDEFNFRVVLKNGLQIQGNFNPNENRISLTGCDFSPNNNILA